MHKAIYDLSARNPLLHVVASKLWYPDDELQGVKAEVIHKHAQFFSREYALETVLEVEAFLQWKWPGRDDFFRSPLVYRTCRIVKNRKITTEFSIQDSSEELYVNPTLAHALHLHYDLNLPAQVIHLDDLIPELEKGLNTDEIRLNTTDEFLNDHSWQIIRQRAVGSFNYKKSLLGEDYRQFAACLSPLQEALLSGSAAPKAIEVPDLLHIMNLDASQEDAIRKALTNNMVIQGPPGTGKSHTIVSLIAGHLALGRKILLVSEKRSALDVVFERLKELKLHYHAAYFNTESDEKKSFYAHLKTSWEKLTEKTKTRKNPEVSPSFDQAIFDVYPELLTRHRDKLGSNLMDLLSELVASGQQPYKWEFSGRVPALSVWKKQLDFLTDFEQRYCRESGAESLGNAGFLSLNRSVYKENDPVSFLDKKLNDLVGTLNRLVNIQHKYQWNKSLDDLTRLAISASIMAMVNRNQLNILNREDKLYNSFSSWSKKFELAKAKVHKLESANRKWKKKPDQAEITELIDLLRHNEAPKGIFGFLKRNPEKLREAFSDFDPKLSAEAKIQLLESLRAEWHARAELEEIRIKLAHNLSVHDPENEIDKILRLRMRLDEVGENEYIYILEHPESLQLIRDLEDLHAPIQQVNQLTRFMLNGPIPEKVDDLQQDVQRIQQELQMINRWLPEIRKFHSIDQTCSSAVLESSLSIPELHLRILYQNLLEETRFEPLFRKMSGFDLLTAFRQLEKVNKQKFKSNLEELTQICAKRIQDKELLLATPSSRIKPVERDKRSAYKVQKRIVLHELKKKKQHLPVKELFNQAAGLIMDVQPVWIMNPLSVSQSLPCTEGLFDVVIFDESSQIPLEDAFPALYRSNQAVVVGDSMQMPPGRFFSYHPETGTLLDQAAVSFKSEMLKWHYRSEHPDLIRFSNLHFYENELITLPPVKTENPICWEFVRGTFENGSNEKEAETLVDYYGNLLKQGIKDIAIIAFSREQEKTIGKILSRKKIPQDEDLILRNLENAQGIEKNIVLISVGYGPDPEGNFRLNFGPVNQENGANRLNVLFTRAIRQMVVFSSVQASDFGLSSNLGVSTLRDFLEFAEQSTQQQNDHPETLLAGRIGTILEKHNIRADYFSTSSGIAVHCFLDGEQGKLLLLDPGIGAGEPVDIDNLLHIFSKRYRKIHVVLTADLLFNPDRVEKEILSFFR